MFRLFPREESFFDLFEQAAQNAHRGALVLADLFADFRDLEHKAAQLETLEHDGDKIIHETMTKLNKTFITPIDREDIHRLISRLDDVVDLMETGVSRMMMYKVTRTTDDLKALTAVLVAQTKILVDLLPRLRHGTNTEEVKRLCIEVNTWENEGDKVMRHALASLFENEKDPVYIIKMKDIYEIFEASTDRCEDVANIVEGIAVKNA